MSDTPQSPQTLGDAREPEPDHPGRDYRDTVFLPKTDFPMRAGLPKREPDFIEAWKKADLYKQLRQKAAEAEKAGKPRPKFILHDGPPYANGDIHVGHAMQKILKDIVNKSRQMQGYDAPYVPGWDCHGLPIEWKIEEKYRKKKKNKDEVDPVEFRRECRNFAQHWIDRQKEQFQRLGIIGNWQTPYITMTYRAEAKIVEELLRFAESGALYRGSKPVMWSPVEKTALAEAEVEYHDHTSTQIDVGFDIAESPLASLTGAQVVIWTTTPWTIPANRAICYGPGVTYVLLRVDDVAEDSSVPAGARLLVAEALLASFTERAGVSAYTAVETVSGAALEGMVCRHPWHGHDAAGGYYDFPVPLLPGEHVTTEAGTGFVHTAPGHGMDDYEVATLKFGIEVPQTVGPDGRYFSHVPLVDEAHVFKAHEVVCPLLGAHLLSRSEMRHSYPHSWRSKAPLIFRNTAQWFISMEKTGLRQTALSEIRNNIDCFPASGRNRIEAMVKDRPDWVISRQRAWGVPITVYVHKTTGELLLDEAVNRRIVEAVEKGGADAWFTADDAAMLGPNHDVDDWEKVTDILDVWFDSGCTHAFCLEDNETWPELATPADLYLEGSDQHRGWFQSSLLESCGTRGRAPYKAVLTHGFVMDKEGRKMSKAIGNTVDPIKVVQQYGADILRLWVATTDYTSDVRIGDEILKGAADNYRKIRNTLRYLLGALEGYTASEALPAAEMPALEQHMLARLADLDDRITAALDRYDFTDMVQQIFLFCTADLSAFYFDIRKDCLYCDLPGSARRRAARTVMHEVFERLVRWLAPVLTFTAEEAWQQRYGLGYQGGSIHSEDWCAIPPEWRALQSPEDSARWQKIRALRSVVLGALEVERRERRIGSSLQASVRVYVQDAAYAKALEGLDLAEICITSHAELTQDEAPAAAFRLDGVADIAVMPVLAVGDKCQRCWVVKPEVTAHGALCLRCADAVTVLDSAA